MIIIKADCLSQIELKDENIKKRLKDMMLVRSFSISLSCTGRS